MPSINDFDRVLSGAATSNTPRGVSNTSGGFAPSIHDLDNVLRSSPQVQPTQAPTSSGRSIRDIDNLLSNNQTQDVYTGTIEKSSPLKTSQRVGLSTENTIEGKKNILKQMGFEPLQDQNGDLLVRQGDKVYPVDEKGFSIGDIAEFFGGQIPTATSIAGAVAGGIAGSVVPGFGTVAGGAIGGGIGAGIGDFIRQKLAQGYGSQQKTDIGEIGIQTGAGIVGGLIPGGKIVQSVVGKFGGNAVIDKLITTGARKTIEEATGELIAKGASEATAVKFASDLISSELSKTLAGRAAINATVGGLTGAGQSAAEVAYRGGNLKDIAGGALEGLGAGALFGVGFGEATHRGIGVVNKALPKPSLESRLLGEFAGRTPTIDEVRTFIDSADVTSAEKTRVLSLLEPQRTPTETVPLGKFALPDGNITSSQVSDALFRAKVKNEDIPTIINKLVEAGAGKRVGNDLIFDSVAVRDVVARDNLIKTAQPQSTATSIGVEKTTTDMSSSKLPKALAGAKPKYGYGSKLFSLEFASDIDKALYIIAKDTKSAKHDAYIGWLKTVLPDKTETQLKTLGKTVKSSIKELAKSSEPGVLTIPAVNQPQTATQTPADIARIASGKTDITTDTTQIQQRTPLVVAEPLPEAPTRNTAADLAMAETLRGKQNNIPQIINPDSTVNVENLYEQSLKGGDRIVSKVGVMGKMLDALTNTFDPKDAKSQWRRAMGRTFASVRKVLNGFGDVGKDMVKTFDDITKQEDRFMSKSKEAASRFVKYLDELTPEQRQEQQLLRLRNNVANMKAEGRNKLRTPEEVLAQTNDPKVKKALQLYFSATKEISAALNGRWYKVDGKPAYKAGEPTLFHPRDYGEQTQVDNTARINEVAQDLLSKNPDMTLRQAEADARRQVEIQQQHSSKVASGYGVKTPINTIDDAITAGFELDDAKALEFFINKNSKTAAIMDVLGKKGIYETSELGDVQDGEQAVEGPKKAIAQYYNQIQADFAKEIDRYIAEKQFNPKEGKAFRSVLTHYLDFSFKGGDIGELWNTARKIQALKLTTSGINNFFQPFLNLLKADFPSFFKGIRAAWFRSASPMTLARLREFGIKDLNDLTVESGAKQHQYLETSDDGLSNTVLDKATKVTGAGLKLTETGNRQGAAIAGFDFAYRAAKVLNDPNIPITTKVSMANDLSLLLGREIKHTEQLVLSRDDMLNAAYNFTKATQFGYDPLNLPHWANTGWGKAIFQFKSFVYNSTRLTFESTIGELQQGNVGRATRNFMIMSLLYPLPGEAIRAFRHYVLGSPTPEDEGIMHRWFGDVGEIVGLGFLDSIIESPDGYSFFVNVFGGPTATTVAQGVDWLRQAVPQLFDGEIGSSLESTFNFATKQFGGAGSLIRNRVISPLSE